MTDKFQDKQVQNIIFNQLSRDKYYKLLEEGKIVENEFYITNDAFKDNAGGLDVLDIGQSLYVDESQGLRRYLNGSWVYINRHTRLFFERLMKAATLNKNLLCSEDEYNQIITNSPYKQCGKFVYDTINNRIKLPTVVRVCGTLDLNNLGEIDNNSTVTTGSVGTEISYPYYIQIATGLETVVNISDNIQINNPYSLGESKYSPIILNNHSWLHYSIPNNPRTLYPAYYDMLLDIYMGKKTVEGITVKHINDNNITRYDHTIDPANQTFNLPSLNGSEDMPRDLYGEKEENNQDIINCMSLLKESGFLYTAPYNGWIRMDAVYEENKYFDLYNQNTRQSSIMSPASSGTVNYALLYCNAGDTVKINYTVTTVRRFEFIVATKPGHLYYYAGEATKNPDLINSSKLGDIMQRHIDGDLAYYLVDSWVSGRNFWRKYSDGWMEQGGWIAMTAGKNAWANTTINLHQPFINTNYLCSALFPSINDGASGTAGQPEQLTKTSFVMRVYNSGSATEPWYACGYWK